MKAPKAPVIIPVKQIKHINYSGLKGRIIHLKSTGKSKRNIVFIAGQHTAHERMYRFGEFLADYGNVYMIDVPGFGGMPSFRKIGKEISYDNYADYLYTVLKTQKLTKDIVFFGASLGGQFVTRMFQKHPDSQKWASLYIGFVSFIGKQDFNIPRLYKASLRVFATISISRIGMPFTKLWRNRYSMWVVLRFFGLFKAKMRSGDAEKRKKHMQMERYLWSVNDARTHGRSALMFWSEDLRTYSEDLIEVPAHNISTKEDQYFDYKEVNKSFRDVYADYTPHYLTWEVHMQSMFEDKEEVAQMIDRHIVESLFAAMEKSK